MTTEENVVGQVDCGSGRWLEVSVAFPRFGVRKTPLIYQRLRRRAQDGSLRQAGPAWIAVEVGAVDAICGMLKEAARLAAEDSDGTRSSDT